MTNVCARAISQLTNHSDFIWNLTVLNLEPCTTRSNRLFTVDPLKGSNVSLLEKAIILVGLKAYVNSNLTGYISDTFPIKLVNKTKQAFPVSCSALTIHQKSHTDFVTFYFS